MLLSGSSSLPAACADCIETTRFAQAGLAPLQNAMQQFRSIEGKLRFNFGLNSLIVNPLTGLRALLNHTTLEARILSLPAVPGMPPIPRLPGFMIPGLPGMPPIPQLAAAAAMATQLEQLGKALIEGHEVQGMRYLFAAGSALALWEIWNSTKLSLPVMTRTVGSFGERVNLCKCTAVQPPAAMFEIPSNYKIIQR